MEKITNAGAGIGIPRVETVKSTPSADAMAQTAITATIPIRVARAKGLNSFFIVILL
jgi:hypothetical protein